MNLELIEKKIQDILECKGDCEISHGMEDALNENFISYIASLSYINIVNEAEDIAAMAKKLKELTDMELDRWYA